MNNSAWDLAFLSGRRVFYEAATDTIRQCPENYLLAYRSGTHFTPAPDKASTINAHSLGIVLTQYAFDVDGDQLARAVEMEFWGKLGSK